MITTFSSAGHEVSLTVNWLKSRPALLAILTEADSVEPDLDFEAFRRSFNDYGATFVWPSRTEAGRASLVWRLMQQMVADIANGIDSDRIGINYASSFTRKTNLNDAWRDFTEQILQPMFDYLTEHVAAESSILYVLERYVRRVEWFDREGLYERAMADTRKTEDVYDEHLRSFLFGEGINMPFSQARSASGESDVLSSLDSDDPLVCEVKVFDAISRKKREIASGFNQAIQYALDYGKQVAYLVVINLSGRALSFVVDDEVKTWPPHLTVSGVRVYLVSVRALPTPSASQQGKASPVVVTVEDLVNPDSPEED
ncbi:hypothetical protein [Kribbella sp. NPDC023855]|uniref:hypothetical protein n=1 Tax=Kribbella sp. NPDC023855 TaxID=3154698 RepID=UPI0033C838E2